MSTPDTNNIGIKLQAAGENLNTWGDPNLNNDFIVVSHLSSGWNPIIINGDYNVAANEINYATNNPSEYAIIKLVAGTVTGGFNFIWPARAKRTLIWNVTGFAAQHKLAATTGFSQPTGSFVWLGTDGAADVYNLSPNIIAGPLTVAGQIHGVSTGTAGTDATNVTQVATAIATASFPASSGTILNSINDTTAGYLSQKITVSGALTISTTSPGGNEKSALSVGVLGLTPGLAQNTSFAAVVNTQYTLTKSGNVTVTLPSSANAQDTIEIDVGGTTGLVTFALNGLKYYGTTTNPSTSGEGSQIFRYHSAARGWIDV